MRLDCPVPLLKTGEIMKKMVKKLQKADAKVHSAKHKLFEKEERLSKKEEKLHEAAEKAESKKKHAKKVHKAKAHTHKKKPAENKGKIEKVMHEYKEGKLHSGSKKGPQVTNPRQALAIALNESRKAGAKIPKKK